MSRPPARRSAPPLRLDQPVKFLRGVGERRADAFARLGIHTLRDLLWHLPHRYLDATSLTPLAAARVGDEVACVGRVVAKGVLPTRARLRIFHAVLKDASGHLECTWPGQAFLDRSIEVGQVLLVQGKVRHYHGRQLLPREHVVLQEAPTGEATGGAEHAGAPDLAAGAVLPIYPATEGLSHRAIRAVIEQHLDRALPLVQDVLPPEARLLGSLPATAEALRAVHRPTSRDAAELGRQRLAFDELVDLSLMLSRARMVAKRARGGIAFAMRRELTGQLKASLPFALTGDQLTAIREITADMLKPERMHRLLMGDVGTGKTIVALMAMLLAVDNGHQAALMAPTELLAEQHAATLARYLAPIGLMPLVLLGKLSAAAKQDARRKLATGAARIVVGTHALVQETVAFERLGLCVIDEQHRFGVEQRAALLGKGNAPDTLLLSATPIPRSLALTLYGDLDVSVLRERPPGRGTIRTAVRGTGQRERVLEFVAAECRTGRQAYVVLPVIDASERSDLRAAVTMHAELAGRWPDLQVGLVHGRLPTAERDRVMRAFRDGTVQVLVATTVIEVGIDVPNATVMLIEHPDRFGLAQLHQLRGRVGRGGNASYCILLAGRGSRRLGAFARTDDGFAISELDLQERGMGDLIGARQSGGMALKVARLPDDAALLEAARGVAEQVLAADPTLAAARHQPLRDRAVGRFPRALELFRVG